MERGGDELVEVALGPQRAPTLARPTRPGCPTSSHPLRVAASLCSAELKALALLHHALEDTDVTVEEPA